MSDQWGQDISDVLVAVHSEKDVYQEKMLHAPRCRRHPRVISPFGCYYAHLKINFPAELHSWVISGDVMGALTVYKKRPSM